MTDLGCPYAACTAHGAGGGCADMKADGEWVGNYVRLCRNGAAAVKVASAKRIIRHCTACHSSNQALARHCRRCGRALVADPALSGPLGINWTVPAGNPASGSFHETPQPILHGDLFVTHQNMKLVFSSVSDGSTILQLTSPGPPRFSATPVSVRERIFVCMPGLMWKVSVVSGASRQIPLGSFHPTEHAYPLSISGIDSDYLIVPGKLHNGAGRILFYDVKSEQFHEAPVSGLHHADEIRRPADIGRRTVIFTTKMGRIFYAQHAGHGPAGWRFLKRNASGLPRGVHLSAPAYEPASRTIFVEYFDRSSTPFVRGVATMDMPERNASGLPRRVIVHPLNPENPELESAGEDDLNLLIFEPVLSGGYAVIRSSLANTCHFVSAAAHQIATINGLLMDPVAVTGGRGKIVTAFGGSIGLFAANPANQTAQSVLVPGLDDGAPVNRLVYTNFGTVLIQTSNQLIGWEVP